jgi:hypothetical protein
MKKAEAAKIGAKWWTDQIKESSPQDVGDFVSSALAEWAKNEVKGLSPLTEQKLSTFQSCLEANILRHLDETEWLETNPIWGSALRTVGIDYHPDRVLRDAIEEADISVLYLPLKTIMWLNPDGVKVSLGHKGEITNV